MPLFEVETEGHIIITWAGDDSAATRVVSDAYPGEKILRMTKRPRDTWVISKSGPGHYRHGRCLPHGPRLPKQSRRRQSPCDPPLHARNRYRPGTLAQSDREQYGHGVVKPSTPSPRYPAPAW